MRQEEKWTINPDRGVEFLRKYRRAVTILKRAGAKFGEVEQKRLDRLMGGKEYQALSTIEPMFVILMRDASGVRLREDAKLSEEQGEELYGLIEMYCDPKPEEGRIDQLTVLIEEKKPDVPNIASSLSQMVVYVKFLHLRDRGYAEPVYKKFIPRLDKEVEVFDEFVILRTLTFKEAPASLLMRGERAQYNYLQPVYPPRTLLNTPYISRKDKTPTLDVVQHLENNPETLSQGAFTIVNGFQRGSEYVGSIVQDHCDRLVLVADFSSLPVPVEKLIAPNPVGHHARITTNPRETLSMQVEQTEMGSFILDSAQAYTGSSSEPGWDPRKHKILKADEYSIWFSVDWDALNDVSPKAK